MDVEKTYKMEINSIYTLYGEVTHVSKGEYPVVIDRIELSAIEDSGLKKLKETIKSTVDVWRKVYFQDSKDMHMSFTIYRNVIVNNMILKDEPVFKSELKNY